ncbi:MAG: corrinoid protein [Kiritimatiellia bacterium]|nr:corrinoid protein [Kiritimatiellia bacterium]
MARVQELYEAVGKGNRKAVEQIIRERLDQGAEAFDLLMQSMIPAMRDLGDRFSRNEVYVPEMLIAARAMQTGLVLLEPLIAKTGHQPVGRVCIGTVKGDLHDIGKNLVAMMLKGAGYSVADLGVDCDAAKFDKAVQEGAQAVLLSALLTTTMPHMKDIVAHFKNRPEVKVIIGGAPVTQQYADEIGAHGYADNAGDAVRAVERALGISA